MTNEENTYEENDLQLASFQVGKSTHLGNEGTSRYIPNDINLENELNVIDTNVFEITCGSKLDVGYSRMKKVRKYKDGVICKTFFYYGQTFGGEK